MYLLQHELDRAVYLWNSHRIRSSRTDVAPYGRPMLMYSLPYLYGAEDQLFELPVQKIEMCEEECLSKSSYPCDPVVFELCCILMTEKDLSVPEDGEQAVLLYQCLRQEIHSNLNMQ